jgi:hypothetical protein
MKMNNKGRYFLSSFTMLIILIMLSMTLTGCTTTSLFKDPETIEKIITIDNTKYPELPKVYYPPSAILLDFKFDWPRTQELTILNKKSCLIIEETNRDKSFWRKCGINKIDIDSNLYIGLSEQDYRNLILNFDKIMAREKQWKSIINEINRQRENFKERNKQ